MSFTCFECGAPAHHAHHVVPRVLGGERTVPLCEQHHSKAEGFTGNPYHRHKSKVRAGLMKARAAGKQLGRPSVHIPPDLHTSLTHSAAAKVLGVSPGTVKRWRRKAKENECPS